MPLKIPKSIRSYIDSDKSKEQVCISTKKAYERLTGEMIDVSIIMPAYNESSNILRALCSLSNNLTNLGVEIIVVNNNSIDDTATLAQACGVSCINVPEQGITHARNGGLKIARGKYILNADADVVYPEYWIEEMVQPLMNDLNVALTYGRFSFIPIGSIGRNVYYIYEFFSQLSRRYNAQVKDEAVNVYGFNSGFRKEQGLAVGGFDHPIGTNEDGYLALKLRKAGYGRLHDVNVVKARVWTTDRRILIDGGLLKATLHRLKRILS